MKLNTLEIGATRNGNSLLWSIVFWIFLGPDPLSCHGDDTHNNLLHHPRTPACGFSFFLEDWLFIFLTFYSTFLQLWLNW